MIALLDGLLLEEAIQMAINCDCVEPALKYLKENSNEKMHKQCLKNIKYFSKNYRKIRIHCDNFPNLKVLLCASKEIQENKIVYCFCEKTQTLEYLCEIKSPKIHKIFDQFNRSLDECYNGISVGFCKEETKRRWVIYHELFISKEEIKIPEGYDGDIYDWIAEKHHINKRTIYKDLEKVYNELALIYFGSYNE